MNNGNFITRYNNNKPQRTMAIFRIQSAGQSPLQTDKHVAHVNTALVLYLAM